RDLRHGRRRSRARTLPQRARAPPPPGCARAGDLVPAAQGELTPAGRSATMARPRLAITIPSLNRGRMLDAVLHEMVPVCEELSIPIFVSDNGSGDATPDVCSRWASRWSGVRFQRHPQTVPFGHSVMSAMAMSNAEYTWLSGDDDYLVPRGIRTVMDWLS